MVSWVELGSSGLIILLFSDLFFYFHASLIKYMNPLVHETAYVFVFGILCLAYGLCFHSSKAHNLSLGGLMGFGYMFVWIAARIYHVSPFLALIPCLIIGGLLNAAVYLGIYSRLSVREELKLLCLLGVEIVYLAFNQIIGFVVRELPQYRTIDFAFLVGEYDVIIHNIPASVLFAFSMLIVVAISTRLNPRYWVMLRSINENHFLTEIQGVNTKRFISLNWFIAGALACFCGGVSGFWLLSSPASGDLMVSYMLAGCFLGGLGSLLWMVIGGGLIGILCSLVVIGSPLIEQPWLAEFLGLIPVVVIAFTLLFEPEGLYCIYKKAMS